MLWGSQTLQKALSSGTEVFQKGERIAQQRGWELLCSPGVWNHPAAPFRLESPKGLYLDISAGKHLNQVLTEPSSLRRRLQVGFFPLKILQIKSAMVLIPSIALPGLGELRPCHNSLNSWKKLHVLGHDSDGFISGSFKYTGEGLFGVFLANTQNMALKVLFPLTHPMTFNSWINSQCWCCLGRC